MFPNPDSDMQNLISTSYVVTDKNLVFLMCSEKKVFPSENLTMPMTLTTNMLIKILENILKNYIRKRML